MADHFVHKYLTSVSSSENIHSNKMGKLYRRRQNWLEGLDRQIIELSRISDGEFDICSVEYIVTTIKPL